MERVSQHQEGNIDVWQRKVRQNPYHKGGEVTSNFAMVRKPAHIIYVEETALRILPTSHPLNWKKLLNVMNVGKALAEDLILFGIKEFTQERSLTSAVCVGKALVSAPILLPT